MIYDLWFKRGNGHATTRKLVLPRLGHPALLRRARSGCPAQGAFWCSPAMASGAARRLRLGHPRWEHKLVPTAQLPPLPFKVHFGKLALRHKLVAEEGLEPPALWL